MPATESADREDIDGLTDEALSQSIAWLRQQANTLRADFAVAVSLEAKQEVRRSQEALRDQADEFVEKRIKLLAASASTTGSRIKGATDAVDQIIARIDNVKSKLQLLGKVLEFFAVVATGKVQPIFEAALKLKDDLSAT
jgi:fructosamine-3-kinase